MKKINNKINQLTIPQIADLESRCTVIYILGGMKTCTTHSIEKFCTMLKLTPKQILKWFTKTRKKYLRKFTVKA